jgi:hypothetical protein
MEELILKLSFLTVKIRIWHLCYNWTELNKCVFLSDLQTVVNSNEFCNNYILIAVAYKFV